MLVAAATAAAEVLKRIRRKNRYINSGQVDLNVWTLLVFRLSFRLCLHLPRGRVQWYFFNIGSPRSFFQHTHTHTHPTDDDDERPKRSRKNVSNSISCAPRSDTYRIVLINPIVRSVSRVTDKHDVSYLRRYHRPPSKREVNRATARGRSDWPYGGDGIPRRAEQTRSVESLYLPAWKMAAQSFRASVRRTRDKSSRVDRDAWKSRDRRRNVKRRNVVVTGTSAGTEGPRYRNRYNLRFSLFVTLRFLIWFDSRLAL